MRVKLAITSGALALALGGAALLAATIGGASVTPTSLTIVQGGTGNFSASVDSLSGSVPPRARNAPDVSYCQEWTIHADGTATCDATGVFSLERGRNYSQTLVAVGEYAGQVTVNVDSDVPCNAVYSLDETFTAAAGSGVDFGADVLQVTRPVAVTVSCPATIPVFDGCSHGYWKNHLLEWPAAYVPSTKLGDVFTLGVFSSLSNNTLKEALEFKGGSADLDKARILLRNAVAGLLNSSHPAINYFATTAELVSAVDAALASGDAETILALEAQLDSANHGSAFCGDSAITQ